MRVSAYLPNWTHGLAWGSRPRWAELAAVARELEAAGFDGLWTADQILQEFENHDPLEFWDSWTIVACLAEVTERMTIGPLVGSAGFRNPSLVASSAATVAEVSDGRLVLGLGAGYDEGEHRMFGLPWDRKVARLEEAAAVLFDLLHGGVSSRSGDWYSTDHARISTPAAVPLLIGTYATGPRMMRITAEYADAWSSWLGFDDNSPEIFAAQAEQLDLACANVGRDPGAIRRIACVSVHLSDEPFRFGPLDLGTIALSGETADLAEQLYRFAGAADEVALYTFPLTQKARDRLADLRAALPRA